MADARQIVRAADVPFAVGPYSHAVRAGHLVYLSGQAPVDPATGKLVEGDLATQTERVFANLSAVLVAAGLTFDHVVKATVYLTDLSDFAAMNEVYGHVFPEPYPARTTVAVAGLPLGAKVGIELVASLTNDEPGPPDKHQVKTMGQDLRATLRAAAGGGPALRRGLWLTFLGPYGLEVAASGGADWLGVDLQHGDLDINDVPGLLRVAERAGLPLLTRMPSHDPALLGRVLDAGVSGVIVPMVDTAEQAAALVSACLPPPAGSRSTGGCRMSLGAAGVAIPQLLLPMVETAAGLLHAAEILAVTGVDGVFFGPYDLSISAGFPGPSSPQTITALREVIHLARQAGKVIGFMAGTPELLAVASEADLVAVDTDVTALRGGLSQLFT